MTKKILILVLMILLITLAAFKCMRAEDGSAALSNEEIIPEAEAETTEPEEAVKTYCFFGLDNRKDDDTGRSDVIMLIRVNNEDNSLKVVSVYRDTLVDMGGLSKVNAAYAYGGPNYAVDVLENNLDISIDGYVSADFKAVRDMIDALGGVSLDVTDEEAGYANNYIDEMNSLYGTKVQKISGGSQTLNGTQAVGFARIRYTEGWDYKRTERQRTVLSLMAEKYKTADENAQKAVMDIFFEEFYTNMTEADLAAMTEHVLTYEFEESAGYPKYRKGISISGIGDCVAPKDMKKNVTWLHEFLYGENDYSPSEEVEAICDTITNTVGE